MSETAAAVVAAPVSPLWPVPLEVIGITGDYQAGKTLFGLTIAPGAETCHIDTEKSGASFLKLGHERIDLPTRLMQAYPNGHRAIDVFTYFKTLVGTLPLNRFRVVFLDVAEEIEAGCADWVMENANLFGRTKGFYLKMTGIYWGDVKATWKGLLADLSSRCETFAFSTHLGKVWGAGGPTGQQKPKGKETLYELASLYLWLERPKLADGSRQEAPSAIVLKERLCDFDLDPVTKKLRAIKQFLPPRLPVATPEAICEYLSAPIGDRALTADEKAPEVRMSDDERAAVRLQTAQVEAETAKAQLERAQLERAATSPPVATSSPAPGTPRQIGDEPNDTPVVIGHRVLNGVPMADCAQLWEEFAHLNGWGAEENAKQYRVNVLERFGVTDRMKLTEANHVELRAALIPAVRECLKARGFKDEDIPF